ncbi:MAG: trans-sulfuration enzyme family protein, partial [Gammaproteobacteria bacterium]
QRPLSLGADLVVHSTTKYLNGHSDMIGGAVIAATAELHGQMRYWGNALGLSGSPFDSFLNLRGLRTLHVRIRQHEANALALAELLAAHPAVSEVHYAGLPSHPDHALARRQQDGFGGMLSFDLKGGEAAARALLAQLQLYTLAESLGGVESLICHPATMSHATFDADSLEAAGIGAGLLRISTGIESTEDLVADLRQGLDAAAV